MTHHLYGIPGAENMDADLASAYESQVDPWADEETWQGQVVIEEWSARPLSDSVPTAERIIEFVTDTVTDEYSGEDDIIPDRKFPHLLGAFEAARLLFIQSMGGWLQADKKLRDIIITWDENGDPLADGEPMYIKRPEIPGQELML